MARSNSSAEQLDIAKNLLAVTQQMAAAVDAVNKKQMDQVQIMNQIQDAMKAMDTKGLVASVDAATKAINELTSKLSNLGKTSTQTLGDMSGQAKQAGTSVTAMATAVTQAGNAANTAAASTGKLATAVQDNTKNTKKAIETWADLQKMLKEKFPKATLFASSALSSLASSFGAVKAGISFAIDAFKEVIGTVLEIGKAIISLPLNFLNVLTEKANKLASGTSEWFTEVQNVKKAFGDLQQPASAALISMAKNNQSLEGTGLNARRMWGSLGAQLKEFNALAQASGALFDNFADEFDRTGKQLPSFAKGLGLAGEEFRPLLAQAKTMGTSVTSVAMTFTKQSLALSKQFGVSAKLISKDMAKALGDVKHFGGATVKQIAAASVYARKLGVELDKITGSLDAFETFEGAAENASKLSQAFGIQVDAFKMMEAQDPAQQIDMLRKSFAAAGKDASTFNRQQLSLLATATGYDEATARQLFSMKNQGKSLDDINKKSDEAEKRQIDQIKALRELKDAMDLVAQSGSSEGGFLDKFLQGVTQGFERTSEFRGLMRNMIGTFHVLRQEGRELGRAIMESFPGMKTFFEGLKEIFNPKKFRMLAGGIVDELKKFFKEFLSGKYSFKQLMEKITGPGGVFDKFMDAQGGAGKKVIEGFKTMWTFVTKVTSEAIRWLSEKVASGIKYIGRLISGKEKLTDGGAGSFLADSLGPIWDALGDAWNNIKPILLETLENVGNSIWNWAKEKLLPMLSDIAPYVLGAIFGGAALKGLLSVAMAGFGKMLMTSLTGTVAQAGQAAAAAAAGPLQQTAATVAQQVAPAVQAPVAAAAKEAADNAGPDLFSQLSQEREAEIAQRKTAGEQLHGAAKASQAAKTGRMEQELLDLKNATKELDAREQIAEAKKKMADIPEIEVPEAVTGIQDSADELMETDKKSKWGAKEAKELGLKLVAIAGALAVGGVLLAFAVLAIANIVGDLPTEVLLKALGTLAVTVLLTLPLMMALKLAEGQDPASVAKNAATMVIALAALGGLAIGLVLLAKEVGSADWNVIGQLLVVMAGLVLLSLPLLAATFLASKINPASTALGIAVIALGVIAMAYTALEIVDSLKGINVQDVDNAAKMLDSISMAFLMMVPILLGAGLIGTIIIASLGIGAGLMTKGMEAMADGVMAVAKTAVDVLKSLQEANLNSSVGPAIDSFLKVMEVVVKMFDSIGGMFETLLDQDFDDADEAAEMLTKGKDFISSLIGSPGSGTGIIGISEEIMRAVKQIKTDELGPSAEIFVNLLGSLPGILTGLQPSPEFYKACDELGGDSDEIGPMVDGATRMIAVMGATVGGLIATVAAQVAYIMKLPMPDAEGAKGVGAILSGLGGILQALMPDAKLIEQFRAVKEGGTLTTGFSALNITKTTEFFKAYLGAMGEALPKLSGGVISKIVGALKELSPDQITKLAGVGEILKALGGLISSLSAAQKDNPIKMQEVKIGTLRMMMPVASTIGDVIDSISGLPGAMETVIEGVKKLVNQMPAGVSADIFEKQIKVVVSLFSLLKSIPELAAAVKELDTVPGAKDGEGPKTVKFNLAGAIGRITEVLNFMVVGTNGGYLPSLMASVRDVYKFLTQRSGGTTLSKVAEVVTAFFENLKKLSESLTALKQFGAEGDGQKAVNTLLNLWGMPGAKSPIEAAMESLNTALGQVAPHMPGIVDSITFIKNSLGRIDPDTTIGAITKFLDSFNSLGTSLEDIIGFTLPSEEAIRKKFSEISGSLSAIAKTFGKDAGAALPGGMTLAQVETALKNVDMTKLKSISTNFFDMSLQLSKIKAGFESVTGTFNSEGIGTALTGLTDVVGKVNALNSQLNEINAGKVQIRAGLQTLAKGLGIGGSATEVRLANRDVVINLAIQVEMKAADVEKAIVLRKESIIRDRLNLATQERTKSAPSALKPNGAVAHPISKDY